MNDRLDLMWLSYLAVSNAACVIRDPLEKGKMQARAARRLDAYFLEMEKDPRIHDPVRLHVVRKRP